jgi:PAS domain-containing protein
MPGQPVKCRGLCGIAAVVYLQDVQPSGTDQRLLIIAAVGVEEERRLDTGLAGHRDQFERRVSSAPPGEAQQAPEPDRRHHQHGLRQDEEGRYTLINQEAAEVLNLPRRPFSVKTDLEAEQHPGKRKNIAGRSTGLRSAAFVYL